MRFALYTAATRTAIGFLSFSFLALCPHSRVHGQLTPRCPQLPACATNSEHALFLERLLPLLVQMLVAGPPSFSPLHIQEPDTYDQRAWSTNESERLKEK
jgi:hypothetical protein